ncbi:MAG: hypothetical protein GAK28_00706 [Luteibacter sp.]|uniref:VpaChn25_0724 family phage protein n=1 Tax=Luteibacter sp. TaxID=1886636 RepID=UPI00137EE71C|nr:ArsR family transcriptional regulator [Luteibacter sp.]KAF1009073.1 MAG: hypothetical protein GAK28_00706 [Luteibacter sp.]
MKTFADKIREDRRLVMLRLLAEQPGYRMNSSVLHAGLHHLAVHATRDDVATDLCWLKEQGLVVLDDVPEAPGLRIAALTGRGSDVVGGLSTVPGVSRPTAR